MERSLPHSWDTSSLISKWKLRNQHRPWNIPSKTAVEFNQNAQDLPYSAIATGSPFPLFASKWSKEEREAISGTKEQYIRKNLLKSIIIQKSWFMKFAGSATVRRKFMVIKETGEGWRCQVATLQLFPYSARRKAAVAPLLDWEWHQFPSDCKSKSDTSTVETAQWVYRSAPHCRAARQGPPNSPMIWFMTPYVLFLPPARLFLFDTLILS